MKTKVTWFDRMMAAVTFAEANEHALGKGFLPHKEESEKKRVCTECDAVLTTEPVRG